MVTGITIILCHSREKCNLPRGSGRATLLHQRSERRILSLMDAPIVIPDTPLSVPDLERFRGNPFDSMIKYVVDVELETLALGGEMHADGEAVLLQNGSEQEFLWGGNLHPWEHPPRIEHTSLINIHPASGNRSMMVEDPRMRERIEKIVQHGILLQW